MPAGSRGKAASAGRAASPCVLPAHWFGAAATYSWRRRFKRSRHAAGPEGLVPGRQPVMVRRNGYHARTLAEAGLLQLTIDAVRELVESFVDADLLSNHLLQRRSPFGRQIEEQRLRREVDLRTGSRDVVLLDVAGIGFRDPVAELAVFPYRGAHRVHEVHLACAEQIMLRGRGPLHE